MPCAFERIVRNDDTGSVERKRRWRCNDRHFVEEKQRGKKKREKVRRNDNTKKNCIFTKKRKNIIFRLFYA